MASSLSDNYSSHVQKTAICYSEIVIVLFQGNIVIAFDFNFLNYGFIIFCSKSFSQKGTFFFVSKININGMFYLMC